jgi:hypothetical protein
MLEKPSVTPLLSLQCHRTHSWVQVHVLDGGVAGAEVEPVRAQLHERTARNQMLVSLREGGGELINLKT